MERDLLISLVTKAQKGDSTAMDELFANFYNDVYYFALKTVKDSDTACDITQETFIKVKLNVHGYKDDTNFSAWLLQITKNLSFNYLSKSKRESLTDSFSTYSVDAKVDEMSEILNKALDVDERQIVVLHAVAGYKHREIAEIVGKPVGTVTWTYKNALDKLKKYLTQEVGK